jgi:hypothetical protein
MSPSSRGNSAPSVGDVELETSRAPNRITSANPIPVSRASKDSGRGQRILAAILLFALAGVLWWFGSGPTRPPRLLGSIGSGAEHVPTVRGVGRFARPRK